MTKHAVITIKLPLHIDELERGPQLAAIKAIKDAVAPIAAEHGAEVTHEIVGPVKPKAERKPRKMRDLGPPVGPSFDPTHPEEKPVKAKKAA